MNNRDRVSTQLVVDEHVKAVLDFMQTEIPTAKLLGVADGLPQLARLLWGHFPQEPLSVIDLVLLKMDLENQSPQVSNESHLVTACAGGDSVVAVDGR